MDTQLTPMQRAEAAAFGVRVDGGAARDGLSGLVSDAIRTFAKPATRQQLRLAAKWGLELDGPTNVSRVAWRLMRFMKCRAWVYSVCRHVADAYWWRTYRDSGLPEKEVVAIAKQLMAMDGLQDGEWDTERTGEDDAGTEDVWLKTGRSQVASWEYAFVVEAARRQMRAHVVRAMKASPHTRRPSARQVLVRVALGGVVMLVGGVLFAAMTVAGPL